MAFILHSLSVNRIADIDFHIDRRIRYLSGL